MSENAVVAEVEAEYDEPRKVELTLAKIDPWSALKISFILAVAVGIATVVITAALWLLLDGMDVFGSVEDFLTRLGAESFLELMEYVRLPRVMSYATILGIMNVVLFTAVCTLGSLLYNLIASLVGGLKVSLMDE
ncbi:DUF3566 domain-containing protein [Scrofimicrobium sp. R131]|uniref:DUF3566 domain-containing protein n=1 Tax=Scrofimicrobium appendicitidis TaxID=3079930 RepID=A0AAU7V7S3_9ACTO